MKCILNKLTNALWFFLRSPPGVGGDGQRLLVWSAGCSVSATRRKVSGLFSITAPSPVMLDAHFWKSSSREWIVHKLRTFWMCSNVFPLTLLPHLIPSLQHRWDSHREHPEGRAHYGLAVWSSGPGDTSWCLHHSNLQGVFATTLCPDCAEQQFCKPLKQRYGTDMNIKRLRLICRGAIL